MKQKLEEHKLDFWLEHNMNVILEGRHGVGKTEIIKAAFDRNNIKYLMYSAATMDPWTDLVGIPRESEPDENGDRFVDYVLPRALAENGGVEVIFIDEFNRAAPKVRNAIMELCQFKSINGRKFENLRCVWAAVNPSDDTDLSYDVEALDPAQFDRFHIQIQVDDAPYPAYFEKRHGEMGDAAISWWKQLSDECQLQVSPRRLDYAIDWFKVDGDIREVLSFDKLPLDKLKILLGTGSIEKILDKLYASQDAVAIAEKFANINFSTNTIPFILRDDKFLSMFGEYLHNDTLSGIIEECATKKKSKDNDDDDADKHGEGEYYIKRDEKLLGRIMARVNPDKLVTIISSFRLSHKTSAVITRVSKAAMNAGISLIDDASYSSNVDKCIATMVGATTPKARKKAASSVIMTLGDQHTAGMSHDGHLKTLTVIGILIGSIGSDLAYNNRRQYVGIIPNLIANIDASSTVEGKTKDFWKKEVRQGVMDTLAPLTDLPDGYGKLIDEFLGKVFSGSIGSDSK